MPARLHGGCSDWECSVKPSIAPEDSVTAARGLGADLGATETQIVGSESRPGFDSGF